MDEETQLLPHSIEAEKSILCSMLRDTSFFDLALEKRITDRWFYVPAHAEIFRTLLEFNSKNIEPEIIAFLDKLKSKNTLRNVGGSAGLSEVWAFTATEAHFDYHLNLVKSKFLLREAINKLGDQLAKARTAEDAEQYLSNLEDVVLNIANLTSETQQRDIKRIVYEWSEMFEKRLNGEQDAKGVSTGFRIFDKYIGGLKPGHMYVIAARPSMGKTAFMMNVAEYVALDSKLPIQIYSLEMTDTQLVDRLAMSRSRVDLSKFTQSKKPTRADIQRINRAAQEIALSGIVIDETPGLSITELSSRARRRHREKKSAAIFIDYLQLMKSTSSQASNSREREIAEISAGLKALSKTLSLPIVVLAQLNRGPENMGRRPKMSDLRESGAIEQDADFVGLLYREAYGKSGQERIDAGGESELIIDKNRNGATGEVPLVFLPAITRFEPASNVVAHT